MLTGTDIIKLCIVTTDADKYKEFIKTHRQKPLIAISTGIHGQLSRLTSPITFVTYALIPKQAGSDQLTLQQINRSFNQPPRKFALIGSDRFQETTEILLRKGFKELGISFGVFGKHERNADLVCREEVGGVVFETGVGDGGEGFWRERLESRLWIRFTLPSLHHRNPSKNQFSSVVG